MKIIYLMYLDGKGYNICKKQEEDHPTIETSPIECNERPQMKVYKFGVEIPHDYEDAKRLAYENGNVYGRELPLFNLDNLMNKIPSVTWERWPCVI